MDKSFLNIDDINKETRNLSRQIMDGPLDALYHTLPCRYDNEKDVILSVEELSFSSELGKGAPF